MITYQCKEHGSSQQFWEHPWSRAIQQISGSCNQELNDQHTSKVILPAGVPLMLTSKKTLALDMVM